jgi:hypothetical protein
MEKETLKVLEWISTEIVAGKSLMMHDEKAAIWNNACDRALRIISHYKKGKGLFQLSSKK